MVGKQKLWLGQFNLFVFNTWGYPFWYLFLNFANWHEQMEIEVYRYDGRDITDQQSLAQAEQNIVERLDQLGNQWINLQ